MSLQAYFSQIDLIIFIDFIAMSGKQLMSPYTDIVLRRSTGKHAIIKFTSKWQITKT
jgi:hypothetical protein